MGTCICIANVLLFKLCQCTHAQHTIQSYRNTSYFPRYRPNIEQVLTGTKKIKLGTEIITIREKNYQLRLNGQGILDPQERILYSV